MLAAQSIFSHRPLELATAGTVLLKRSAATDAVIFVDSGSVLLGVMGSGASAGTIEHQLGVVEGPRWLDATAAVLNMPCAVDAVAQTAVHYRSLPLKEFRAYLAADGHDVRSMLQDIAHAHRQQTELTVSRLAKDAEARCAEWLLCHAKPGDQGGCTVHLLQRKRAIAAQLGIAPETLSRVLRHLRELRLISGSGRVLDLVDPAGLRALAGSSAPCLCGAV